MVFRASPSASLSERINRFIRTSARYSSVLIGLSAIGLVWIGILHSNGEEWTRTEKAAIQNGADANAAWEILQTEIAPIDDIRSTAEYRRKVTRNILHEFMGRVPAGK